LRFLLLAGLSGGLLQGLSLALAVSGPTARTGLLAVVGSALTGLTVMGLVLFIVGRARSAEASLALARTRTGSDSEPESFGKESKERANAASPASLEEIAHDINDLMTVIVTQAELLRERHAGFRTAELEPILDAASRLSGVARKLIAVARHERLKPPVSVRRILFGPGIARAPRPASPPAEIPAIADGLESVRDRDSGIGENPAISECRRIGGARVVLLVEDEPVLLRATRRMLEQRGLGVLAAENGAQALELARLSPVIDVLMTDLSLPGFDGMELARRLRASHPRIQVLFMSGYDAAPAGLAPGSGGKEAFLAKPFTARELEARLAELSGPADPEALAQPG
jgi:CheY-like chemotaxis protein